MPTPFPAEVFLNEGIASQIKRLGFEAQLVDLRSQDSSAKDIFPQACVIVVERDATGKIPIIAARIQRQLRREMPVWQESFDAMRVTASTVIRRSAQPSAMYESDYSWGILRDSVRRAGGLRIDLPDSLRKNSASQPWLIVDVTGGGLDRIGKAVSAEGGALVTCSSAPHHGVFRLDPDGFRFSVLATSRAPGCTWNSASDFGHEGAHAAFAHVPLFSQKLQEVASGGFAAAVQRGLSDRQMLGVWCYLAAEVLVWFMRKEPREATETGLRSLKTTDDLTAFLREGLRLENGTECLLHKGTSKQGRLDQRQEYAKTLATVCWNVQQTTDAFVSRDEPPTLEEWKQWRRLSTPSPRYP